MAINKINEDKISAIKAKSVKALPNRPSEKGYTAEQLKNYFTNIVLDADDSAISEINRIVDEINNSIGDIGDASIKDFVITYIIGKLTEEAPLLSLDYKDGILKYTKYGINDIYEIDISPKKIALDIIEGKIDNKEFKEYIIEAHENSQEALDRLKELVEGADETLNTIGEISKALKDNANIIDTLVVKEQGKRLSTNDFTNEDKQKLDNTPSEFANVAASGNYDDLNNKPELFDGDYNSLTNKPEIPNVDALASKEFVEEYAQPKGEYLTEVKESDITNALGYVVADKAQLDEVNAKVQGREQALSFDNTQQIIDWINGIYIREDGVTIDNVFIGQNLYTRNNDDNDYWVSIKPITSIDVLSILPTDKIELSDYVKDDELARIAKTGDYTDLKNTPDIPTDLNQLNDDANHRLVTDEILNTINENKSDVQSLEQTKLNKELGSNEANKMLVTDANGNITTANAGNSYLIEDNLESNATNRALSSNQGRILNDKKLDKQQGASNKDKFLYVNDEGLVDLQPIKTKLSEFTNDKNYVDEEYVNQNGGKIDSISVNGIEQEIIDKNVDINVDTSVFVMDTYTSFTLWGNNDLQNGIYILKAGGIVYYGYGANSTSSTYAHSCGADSVLIYSRNIDFVGSSGSAYFKLFIQSKSVVVGATSYSSSTSRSIAFADGTSQLNKILQVTTATNQSSNVKTEATWQTPPTANNGKLTITRNNVEVGTFTANQSNNVTFNIDVPTDTADLANGAGFAKTSDIPTVNNGTLTIQQNGTTIGTFSADQSTNTTINIAGGSSGVVFKRIAFTPTSTSNITTLSSRLSNACDTNKLYFAIFGNVSRMNSGLEILNGVFFTTSGVYPDDFYCTFNFAGGSYLKLFWDYEYDASESKNLPSGMNYLMNIYEVQGLEYAT